MTKPAAEAEAAREWLLAQVMDMDEHEETLVKSLAALLTTYAALEREECARFAERVAVSRKQPDNQMGDIGAGIIIAASIIAQAIRSRKEGEK